MKMHALPQIQHSPSPLQRPNPQCCLEKKQVFIVSVIYGTHTYAL